MMRSHNVFVVWVFAAIVLLAQVHGNIIIDNFGTTSSVHGSSMDSIWSSHIWDMKLSLPNQVLMVNSVYMQVNTGNSVSGTWTIGSSYSATDVPEGIQCSSFEIYHGNLNGHGTYYWLKCDFGGQSIKTPSDGTLYSMITISSGSNNRKDTGSSEHTSFHYQSGHSRAGYTSFYFTAEVKYSKNPILLASDSRWSDIDQEDVKLQEGFELNGFIVSKMSGFTTGSLSLQLSGYSHFVYPEAETGTMSTYFNDNDYDALSSWIDFGGDWTSIMRADSITMMNTMFDWSIIHQTDRCGDLAQRISDILKGGPESLKGLDATWSVKTSSLPSEATCAYGIDDCCWVFIVSVGKGAVSWLGYDWHPSGDSSAVEDWNDVAALTLISGYTVVKACHWISIDLNSKNIKGADFFGYECPSKEFISEIKVQRYKSNSHLHNNPVEVRCCEIAGTHHVTETCVDHFTQDIGTAEDALCEGNSVLSGIYNIASQIIDQNDLEYDQTMAHRCCEISECEAEYCTEGNGLSIDESSCITIGHESDPESDGELSILSCPAETVLKKINDIDVALGVQEVYEIECCDLVQIAPPSLSPSINPSHSPSVSPTTTCMNCLMTLHKENIANYQLAMSRYQECLDNHCCA